MKRNVILDFLTKNGFLPNKKAAYVPVPVKAKQPLPLRKGK